MKRYAVLDNNLTFNNQWDWFDHDKAQWVEQKKDEQKTIETFEKKYGVKLEWRNFPDNNKYKGYFVANKQEVA